MSDPALARLIDQVQTARAAGGRLSIRGGGTKAFYGGPAAGEPLHTAPLAGIGRYEPTELYVTARAGTPLAELEAALAEHGQCLPFEPPRFSRDGQDAQSARDAPGGTVGGMVAAGLAGPARASAGSVRDHVLGASLVNGRGELLHFGGQVMKNVAGYDVSRLLAGSMGVLGVICEVSLKVLPVPPATATLRFEAGEAEALGRLQAWGRRPLPLSASAWWDGTLVVRLSGAGAAVAAAQATLGGETIEPGLAGAFWAGLRDQHDEFFQGAAKAVATGAGLWRLSVPPTAAPLQLPGEQLAEWGGAQRWLVSALPAATVREAARRAGGHATLWRSRDASAGAFAPLEPVLARLHANLERAFDPDGVFDRGRLHG